MAINSAPGRSAQGKNPPDPRVAERLRVLHARAEFATQKVGADNYGIGAETYKKMLSGERGLTRTNAEKIANWHRIRASWLLTGEGSPDGSLTVPLRGCIGAGQAMMLFDDQKDSVEAFFDPETTVAFEVQGDSMLPVARNRDIVYFGPPRRDLRDLVHHECAVILEDGRRFFKILQNGSKKGLYSLASYNSATIPDVEVHSAGPLLGVRRRG